MVLGIALSLAKLYYLFLYPMKQTYEEIRNDGQDLKLWSYFWVILSLFSILEIFTNEYIHMIPLYDWMKVLVFMWLYNQNFKGALLIGEKFKPQIRDVVEKTKPMQEKIAPLTE